MADWLGEALEAARDPFALIVKGPRVLAEWMDQRREKRYQEFIDAARVGDVFPENAEAMTAEDLVAIMRSLEQDMEAEKSVLYGRLARTIALGRIVLSERRHFIKVLRELSFHQVEQLRSAHVSTLFNLYPGSGSGRMVPKDFLASLVEHDKLQIEQFGLWAKDSLSPTGKRLVEACYLKDELTPQAIGAREWVDGMLDIICNEIGEGECSRFIDEVTMVGHGRLVKVRNQAAFRSNNTISSLFPASMAVLLYFDPSKLTSQWKFVEERIRPGTEVVTASFDDGSSREPTLSSYRHFNLASGIPIVASEIIDHFLAAKSGER
ncbi:hypothetical protein [Stenotrophomonas sp.]|uniref:hypothetical protein n=1 Tax=Stenotrophomonas sp. TaxID=69392 RepID=UPI0025ECA48C|nr:hypothetical protein [Stenotrophomonas sp.]MBW8374972.1 hypothetical protein [Stenotrophomonas sp.]